MFLFLILFLGAALTVSSSPQLVWWKAYSPFLGEVKCSLFPISQYPTLDGTCNSLITPSTILFGSTGSELPRLTPNSYTDKIQKPVIKISARKVSNKMSSQSHPMPNPFRTTQLLPFLGQFIDHDLDLTPEGHTERFDIPISPDDCLGNHCPTHLEFFRSEPAEKSNHKTRQFRNVVTSFLDLSSIYGSTKRRARKLRLGRKGLLKTRTINGEEFLPLNKFVGVEMDRNNPNTLAAGDVRANEHLILIAVTTLFVREHNRLARKLARSSPGLSDEKLYQMARIRNIAQYQSIVYEQFLPALLGKAAAKEFLGDFYFYNPLSKPDISLEFSTAVFRWGHSAIPNQLIFENAHGQVQRKFNLTETFFVPEVFEKNPSLLNNGLIGITRHLHEEIDTKVVNGLRSGLFQNVQRAFDLVAFNLQRGRDHGLGSFNQLRKSLGLRLITGPTEWSKFYRLTGNKESATKLHSLYRKFNNCDMWVCGLAERKYKDSQLGVTFSKATAYQFRNIRSADRFFYKRLYHLKRELRLPISIGEIYKRNIPSLNGEKEENGFTAST